MGLYNSELDINKSDPELLSEVPIDLPLSEYESPRKRSRKKRAKTDSSSLSEDEELEGLEEEEEMEDEEMDSGEETLKELEELEKNIDTIFPEKKEKVDPKKALGITRVELRKMQEALTLQEGDIEHPNQMDLRVGKIIYIQPHEFDLYISEVDLGGYDESRVVSTGLQDHYPDYMTLMNRYVVILCNIEPTDDREIKSKTGKLLLATKIKFDEEGKEIGEYAELAEPLNCYTPGARIYIDKFPEEEPRVPKGEEYFDYVMKDFTVDSNKQIVWRGQPLKIEDCPQGKVVVSSLSDTYCKLD